MLDFRGDQHEIVSQGGGGNLSADIFRAQSSSGARHPELRDFLYRLRRLSLLVAMRCADRA